MTDDIHTPIHLKIQKKNTLKLLILRSGMTFRFDYLLNTSSSVINMLGSGDCVIPKLDASCLTTAVDTSRPAAFENFVSTLFDDPLLLVAMIGDKEVHSEYIIISFLFPCCDELQHWNRGFRQAQPLCSEKTQFVLRNNDEKLINKWCWCRCLKVCL